MADSVVGREELACMYVDTLNAHASAAREDPDSVGDLISAVLDICKGGRPLGEIALQTQSLGLAGDADVDYISRIPDDTQEKIRRALVDCLEREPKWMIQFAYEVADGFDVRVEEDADKRTMSLVFIGPHAKLGGVTA
jgi:hypothetical protein